MLQKKKKRTPKSTRSRVRPGMKKAFYFILEVNNASLCSSCLDICPHWDYVGLVYVGTAVTSSCVQLSCCVWETLCSHVITWHYNFFPSPGSDFQWLLSLGSGSVTNVQFRAGHLSVSLPLYLWPVGGGCKINVPFWHLIMWRIPINKTGNTFGLR